MTLLAGRFSLVLILTGTLAFCIQIDEANGLSGKALLRWTLKAVGNVAKKATSAVYKVKDAVVGESCNSRWIIGNVTGLVKVLKSTVCGQELAVKILTKVFRDSYKTQIERPSAVLALHFNGGVGTGKTFVAQIIASHLYRKGENSDNVHIFSPITHYPDRSMDAIYVNRLRLLLAKYIRRCRQQLFIFDDFDKMGYLVSTVVSPILSTSGLVNGVDFSRSVFIFIGTNQQETIESVLASRLSAGQARSTLSPADFDIQQHCDVREFAACQSSMVTHQSHNVPFLPLEREHVVCCLRAAAKRHKCDIGLGGNSQDLTEHISFTRRKGAAGNLELAAAGCKKLDAQLWTVCR